MTSLTPGAPDNSWRQGLRSRRRVLMVVSLLTAGCLLVGDGLAQEPPRLTIPPPPPPTSLSDGDAFGLWNECAPIDLVVEGLSNDAADIDLTEERIQTLADSRLRAARLYDAAARPYHLYVRVGVLVSENRRGGAYSIEVSFQKYLRDGVSDQNGFAATWDTGSYGTHGGDAGFILQSVSEHLDRFVLEYLRGERNRLPVSWRVLKIGCLRHSLLIRQPICVRAATRTMTARLG